LILFDFPVTRNLFLFMLYRWNNWCNIISEKNSKEPKIWDQWGNWSTCSVTCGIGKIMRWRHCIGGRCSLGEKKAQLKTCTSAAC